MRNDKVNVSVNELVSLIKDIFMSYSLDKIQSEIGAKVIVEAELMGKKSHGISRVIPFYIPLLKDGTIDTLASVDVSRKDEKRFLIDSRNSFGPYCAFDSMSKAIKMSQSNGIGIVSVKNATHFGMASYYSKMATNNDCIGIVLANGKPAVVAPGGYKSLIGTNAMSLAFPNNKDYPVILDIGLGATSLGNLFMSMKKGDKVPSHYATQSLRDDLGIKDRTEICPEIIYNKRLLTPLGSGDKTGEYKGFQLGLMIDLFLTLFLEAILVAKKDLGESSQVFISIDPYMFVSKNEYEVKMKLFFELIKNYETMEGYEKLRVPGERSHSMKKKQIFEGIWVDATVFRELQELWNERTNPDESYNVEVV